ncbi:hypothetical protein ANN_13599 [Periplaneta americana]|uniref:Ionotropic glutamate receptor C-terminal domain-containing protein n=1 Tax=Periplaneta americana TaxID=6978 RepID=A0ABQ8TM20_PERAM|nr:hypothetical protein ANN_13599 [Periplaneta americana]
MPIKSFSQYKSFGDNRHAFLMENLEMTFVVHCNSRPTTSTQVWLAQGQLFDRKKQHFTAVLVTTQNTDNPCRQCACLSKLMRYVLSLKLASNYKISKLTYFDIKVFITDKYYFIIAMKYHNCLCNITFKTFSPSARASPVGAADTDNSARSTPWVPAPPARCTDRPLRRLRIGSGLPWLDPSAPRESVIINNFDSCYINGNNDVNRVGTRRVFHSCLDRCQPQDETEPQSRQLLDVVLSQMNIFLDSDLTIGSRSSNTEFSLTEAYRRRSWGGLIKRKIAHWREGYGVQLLAPRIIAARRMNQHQELVKSAMVVTNNDTLNHLGDDVDRHIDSLTKANHVHLAHVLRILNARSAFLFRPPPLSFVQNIFTLPFSRAVWLSSVALLALMGALLYCNLKLEFRRGEHTLQSAAEPVKASWSDVVLLSFGVVCQQGKAFHTLLRSRSTLIQALLRMTFSHSARITFAHSSLTFEKSKNELDPERAGAEVEARGVSGRTITFLLYISVIFLYTSYSACIVALLQSTTDSIQTLRDLYESGMEMGVLDIVYSHHFFSYFYASWVRYTITQQCTERFQIASDPLRRSIYTKKINPPGGPSNFFSLEEGLAKVRKGLFAFHHELGPGYYIVSNTFLEEEKCGLHTVTYSQDFVSPWIAVTKNSPLKEIFAIAYRMLHESGLQIRESERFYQKKPDCSSAGSSFVSVGIADCYPALLVLGYGALCSLLAFLLERLVHNKFSGRVEYEATCWRAVERLPAFPRTKQS